MPLQGLPFVLETMLDSRLAGNSLSSLLNRGGPNFTHVSIRFAHATTGPNNVEVQYKRGAPSRLGTYRQRSQDRPQYVML